MLRGETENVLGEAFYLALWHANCAKQLLQNACQGADAVSCQEDRLGGRLAVRRQEPRGGAEADRLEGGIVVLVLPLGELLEHARGVGDVLEAMGEDPWQPGELCLETEEYRADGRLNLVQYRCTRVAVVEDHPFARELLFVFQHLVETCLAVRILVHDRAVIPLPLPQGYSAQGLLLGDEVGGQPQIELHTLSGARLGIRVLRPEQHVRIGVVFALGMPE
mmetsp:Transcript_49586/g.130828  ORF Transcript_49586/g.130828 Transcript_49586/m.130828 type:complete len:221 (+) Transcript_49586:521-1183(+)